MTSLAMRGLGNDNAKAASSHRASASRFLNDATAAVCHGASDMQAIPWRPPEQQVNLT